MKIAANSVVGPDSPSPRAPFSRPACGPCPVAFRLYLTLLLTLILAPLAQAAAQARELLAEGAPDRLWVADVVRTDNLSPTSAERTRVYSVAVPQDGWQRPMLIGAGVRDVAHRGSQFVALLKTGEWMFVWPDGRSTGPGLPADGELVSVGSDGSTIWAVGRVAGGMKSLATATTRPTSEPTTEPASASEGSAMGGSPLATTTATTRPAAAAAAATTVPATGPMTLVLFRLDRSTWVPEGELPDAIPASVERASLEIIRGRVFLAAAIAGQAVIFERDANKEWTETGRLQPNGVHVVRAKVLDGGDRAIVWAAGVTGAGSLYFGNGLQPDRQWGKPVDLRVQSDLSQPLPRDVTVVAQRVRLAFAKGEKLFLQSFDWRDGRPAGQLSSIPLNATGPADSKVGFWLNMAVMAILLLVMASAMRRRGEIEETVRHLDRIPLAPLSLRLAAAVVDLWPQWAAAVIYFSIRPDAMENAELFVGDPLLIRLSAVAMGVYILHTMVLEMLVGASVGKLLFGLRVVLLNGDRPGRGSMFVRNLLRAVDLSLVVGLVMILMSPLRQRIGDIAASTIVVRRTAVPQETPEEDAAAAE